MASARDDRHPPDRRWDQRPVVDGAAKPPVLRRSTIRAICGTWLVLVAYGTLGPLGSGSGRWLAPADSWNWFPPARSTTLISYNDIFTNVLVYVPVGIALALLVRRRGGLRALELGLAMFLAISLSYLTEILQQFMPSRYADRGDLLVNSVAALFGCLIAPRAQRGIRRVHDLTYWHWRTHPWLVMAWASTALTAVLMTIPWDFTWPSIEVQWQRDFDLLDFRRVGAFGLLGFTVTMAMYERLGTHARAVGEVVKRLFVLGVMLEAAQIPLKSHACGLLDIGTAFFGGLAGCGAARWLAGLGWVDRGMPTRLCEKLASLALLALVAYGLIAGVLCAEGPAGPHRYGPSVLWTPFQVHFLTSFDLVLADAAESLFLYLSLTALCLYLTRGRGRSVALLLLVGLVGVVELAQMHFLGGVADVTALILAFVAWLIAVRCWNAFVPQSRGHRVRSAASGTPAPQ